MTPIEVLKMLKNKINEAEFYKSNYVLQTNDVEAINQALHIHDVVGRSEHLPCDKCENGLISSKDRLKGKSCDCGK